MAYFAVTFLNIFRQASVNEMHNEKLMKPHNNLAGATSEVYTVLRICVIGHKVMVSDTPNKVSDWLPATCCIFVSVCIVFNGTSAPKGY